MLMISRIHISFLCFFMGVFLTQPTLAQTKRKTAYNHYLQINETGQKYQGEKEHEKALTFFLKANEIDQKFNFTQKPHLHNLANLFEELKAYDLSITFEKKFFVKQNGRDRFQSASNIGINYLWMRNFKKACYYFDIQLKIARKLKDSVCVALALNNFGLANQSFDHFQEADHYYFLATHTIQPSMDLVGLDPKKTELFLSIVINRGTNLQNLDRCVESIALLEKYLPDDYTVFDKNRIALFQCYLRQGEYQKARNYLHYLERICDFSLTIDQLILVEQKMLLAIHEKRISSIAQLNQLRRSLFKKHYRELFVEKSRITKLVRFFLYKESANQIKNHKIKQSLLKQSLHISEKTRRWTLFGGLFLFCVILTIIYLGIEYYRMREKKAILVKNELELMNLKKELTIQGQKNNLIDFALDLDRNKQFDEQIIKKLKSITLLPSEQILSELKTFLSEYKLKSNLGLKTENAVDSSTEFLSHFKFSLLRKHPNLRKSDVQLCQYIYLELSNQEIADLKNISLESVKNAKTRLKHKLDIDKTLNLRNYLLNLISNS